MQEWIFLSMTKLYEMWVQELLRNSTVSHVYYACAEEIWRRQIELNSEQMRERGFIVESCSIILSS